MWVNILGTIILFLIIGLIVSPVLLVIKFPNVADPIVSISKTLIPWLSGILILLIFNEGVKELFLVVSNKIKDLTKFSAGGAQTEFENQQKNLIPLTPEEYKKINDAIINLKTSKESESAYAWHYFIKYLVLTIYGSQVKILKEIKEKGPLAVEQIKPFYDLFLKREPKNKNYQFISYLDFLTSNFLIKFSDTSKKYELLNNGEVFLGKLDSVGFSWDKFPG